MDVLKAVKCFNLFTVLKKLKECVGFFFFNNLIATNYLIDAINVRTNE